MITYLKFILSIFSRPDDGSGTKVYMLVAPDATYNLGFMTVDSFTYFTCIKFEHTVILYNHQGVSICADTVNKLL